MYRQCATAIRRCPAWLPFQSQQELCATVQLCFMHDATMISLDSHAGWLVGEPLHEFLHSELHASCCKVELFQVWQCWDIPGRASMSCGNVSTPSCSGKCAVSKAGNFTYVDTFAMHTGMV